MQFKPLGEGSAPIENEDSPDIPRKCVASIVSPYYHPNYKMDVDKQLELEAETDVCLREALGEHDPVNRSATFYNDYNYEYLRQKRFEKEKERDFSEKNLKNFYEDSTPPYYCFCQKCGHVRQMMSHPYAVEEKKEEEESGYGEAFHVSNNDEKNGKNGNGKGVKSQKNVKPVFCIRPSMICSPDGNGSRKSSANSITTNAGIALAAARNIPVDSIPLKNNQDVASQRTGDFSAPWTNTDPSRNGLDQQEFTLDQISPCLNRKINGGIRFQLTPTQEVACNTWKASFKYLRKTPIRLSKRVSVIAPKSHHKSENSLSTQ